MNDSETNNDTDFDVLAWQAGQGDPDAIRAVDDFIRDRLKKSRDYRPPGTFDEKFIIEHGYLPGASEYEEAFLTEAWRFAVSTQNTQWVEDLQNTTQSPDDPCSDIGEIVKKFLQAGIPAAELARYTKELQRELLFNFGYILEDPYGVLEALGVDPEVLSWGFYETNATGTPTRRLSGLPDGVITHDPDGLR